MKEYALASKEENYEDPGQQEPIIFMASEGEFNDVRNASFWEDKKNPSFTRLTYSENTKLNTADVCISVAKGDIRNATGMVNYLL